tara:strand:+ start:158 stop:592 length:435 start_codon:yes stop_codon:yes gene_type:complete
MSRVVVNEIEAKVGNDVKFNSNIANPTIVQGEGTATTNLQQGLCKFWANFDGTAVSTIRDSFNLGTITDNGTGDYTTSFTNSMSGIGTVHTASCDSGSGHIATTYNLAENKAASCRTYILEEAGSTPSITDTTLVMTQISGDLA